MKSDDIVPFLSAQPPDDLGFRQGTLLAWDPSTESNTVQIAGQEFTDLPVLAVGTIAMAVGDLIGVLRYKSTYLILGRIAPAGTGALQTRAALVIPLETSSRTTWGDLTTVGPTVDAYIGSSRQALVLLTAAVGVPNGDSAMMNVEVSGASTISANLANAAYLGTAPGSTSGAQGSASGQVLLTAADGLNHGLNTFKAVYQTLHGQACGWQNRRLTVIPF